MTKTQNSRVYNSLEGPCCAELRNDAGFDGYGQGLDEWDSADGRGGSPRHYLRTRHRNGTCGGIELFQGTPTRESGFIGGEWK